MPSEAQRLYDRLKIATFAAVCDSLGDVTDLPTKVVSSDGSMGDAKTGLLRSFHLEIQLYSPGALEDGD